MGFFETLDRIKPRDVVVDALSAPVSPSPGNGLPPYDGEIPGFRPDVKQEQAALVIDAHDRTVVTIGVGAAGVETAALDPEKFLTRIRGQMVGAEEANRNGQFWATGDLAFGIGSVVGGPLNWVHQDRHIIGSLVEARLRPAETAAAGAHIEAESVVWSWLFPNETRVIHEAAGAGKLYYSMECISREVQCVGPNGCQKVMAYRDAYLRNEAACEHIRAKASVRRLINPVFQGAAVIVPPVIPGWADAHATIVQRASANDAVMAFTDGDELSAAQILSYAATPTS